ncbi:DUF945 domain-containing protein [Grimontia hollisae]|uniref:DUF945 domain-containing protein n=1 Tax=Grimontia hollisae CIP 101886 TaxID=675812 RepID=D0IB80_GRIHO|nr:DUF945 family protein [Grimontia hollisae]AMG32073.1 DUF945 domain-containing protein [Grimontia hollisae]EEY71148.1 hypothetical protein VHA_003007 [Grimontia hollisae CIP 101886]MDF2186470.1 DUF945 family protein [Grimontia hollisae]STO43971.1 Bacterial protein of uncharacterised function (DUF945) [Grimontia hollisae]
MIFGKYAAIAGAVAVAAVWPFATGQIGQSQYQAEIEKAQLPYLTIENVKYDRGYLSSDVITRFSLTGATKAYYEEEGLPTTFSVVSQVNHGFLSVSSTSSLEMTPEVKALSEALWSSDESPFVLKTQTSIFGDTEYHMTVRAINGGDNEITVMTSPMDITGTADREGNIVYQLDIPSAELIGVESEKLTFSNITGQGQGKMVDEMWVGKQVFNTASASLTDVSGVVATMTNLVLDIDNNLVSASGGDVATAETSDLRISNNNTFSFEKLDVPQTIALDNFKLGINFRNLDYSALLALANTADSMSAEPTEDELMTLMTLLDRLVEKGMAFELLPLEMGTPEGQVDAKFTLSIEPGLGSVTQNIGALMSKLQGNVFMNVPAAYVHDVPAVAASVNNLEPYGFISESEKGVTLKAKIEGDEAVSPSGKRIPLALLMMMFM